MRLPQKQGSCLTLTKTARLITNGISSTSFTLSVADTPCSYSTNFIEKQMKLVLAVWLI